ncbi:hypothetical protein [Paludibaculum fermentans]|uniref:hypothetical protein n=1 Tax=Paludibaculum fermentans TaxID=1473598 RepID=UPI003EB81095
MLSLAVAGFGRLAGFDRDRAFYATVLIVVASYYVLFAVMAGGGQVLVAELVGLGVFGAAAVLGFRLNPWIVAAGLAGHGVFDSFHGRVITNSGMPEWWPAFCGSYDVCAGAILAWLLWRERKGARRDQTVANAA